MHNHPLLRIAALVLVIAGSASAETLHIGPEARLAPTPTWYQSCAVSLPGGGLITFWPEGAYNGPGKLMAIVAGGETPAAPVALRSTTSAEVQYPAAASSGSRVFVTWFERQPQDLSVQLLGMVLDAAGHPLSDVVPVLSSGLDPTTYDPTTYGASAAVVWTGSVFAVVSTATEGRLLIRRFTESGEAIDAAAKPVTDAVRVGQHGEPSPQIAPAAASSGAGALLAWQDGSPRVGCQILCPAPPPPGEIDAVRLDLDGRVVDAVPLRISQRAYSLRPAVAWNGGRYLIAWSEETEALGISKSLNFTVFEDLVAVSYPGKFVPSTSHYLDDAAVSPLREGFALAWSDSRRARRNGPPYLEPLDIYVLTIDRNGDVSSEEIPLSAGPDTQSNCSLVPFFGRLVAVYERVPGVAPNLGEREIVVRSVAPLAPRSRSVRR